MKIFFSFRYNNIYCNGEGEIIFIGCIASYYFFIVRIIVSINCTVYSYRNFIESNIFIFVLVSHNLFLFEMVY